MYIASVVAMILFVPSLVFAALSPQQIESVAELLNSFGTDSSTIATVRSALGDATAPSSTCVNLLQNLTLGSTDAFTGGAVTQLQTFLQGAGYFTYTGAKGYYGYVTAQAVGRYQIANGIVSLANDDAYGMLGPQTRARMACTQSSPQLQGVTQAVQTQQSEGGQQTPLIQYFTVNGQTMFTMPAGGAVALAWQTSGATSCSITADMLNANGGTGAPQSVAVSGVQFASPANSTAYVLNCHGANELAVHSSVLVSVAGSATIQTCPAGSIGTYPSCILSATSNSEISSIPASLQAASNTKATGKMWGNGCTLSATGSCYMGVNWSASGSAQGKVYLTETLPGGAEQKYWDGAPAMSGLHSEEAKAAGTYIFKMYDYNPALTAAEYPAQGTLLGSVTDTVKPYPAQPAVVCNSDSSATFTLSQAWLDGSSGWRPDIYHLEGGSCPAGWTEGHSAYYAGVLASTSLSTVYAYPYICIFTNGPAVTATQWRTSTGLTPGAKYLFSETYLTITPDGWLDGQRATQQVSCPSK